MTDSAIRDVSINNVNWRGRIHTDAGVLAGKPVVKGTRLSVELVVGLLADGWTRRQVVESYPTLSESDVQACLAYAREVLEGEKVYTVDLR